MRRGTLRRAHRTEVVGPPVRLPDRLNPLAWLSLLRALGEFIILGVRLAAQFLQELRRRSRRGADR